jgi:hypothetical protein
MFLRGVDGDVFFSDARAIAFPHCAGVTVGARVSILRWRVCLLWVLLKKIQNAKSGR